MLSWCVSFFCSRSSRLGSSLSRFFKRYICEAQKLPHVSLPPIASLRLLSIHGLDSTAPILRRSLGDGPKWIPILMNENGAICNGRFLVCILTSVTQSQSSSDSSFLASRLFCCLRLSSSSFTLDLARTPERINRASRSRVVKSSGVRPSPSKPMILSAPIPSMKAMTQGSTWTFSLVTRNGQLSTLILSSRAS
jgi:hypothetical protein